MAIDILSSMLDHRYNCVNGGSANLACRSSCFITRRFGSWSIEGDDESRKENIFDIAERELVSYSFFYHYIYYVLFKIK